MSKKVYAVRAGRKTGIFDNWDECKASVTGFSGAVYMGFSDKKSAEEWFKNESCPEAVKDVDSADNGQEYQYKIYCDGSYDAETKIAGYGIVVLQNNEVIYTKNDSFPDEFGSRNVTGEIHGVIEALAYCKEQNINDVEILYDYAGIESWAKGEWAANKSVSKYYVNELQTKYKNMDIKFTKVPAHSGVEYNELADRLAKEAVEKYNSISPC